MSQPTALSYDDVPEGVILPNGSVKIGSKYFLSPTFCMGTTRKIGRVELSNKIGERTPHNTAVVNISVHGVIPSKDVAGFDKSIIGEPRKFRDLLQIETLSELESFEKLTITTPGIVLYTYDADPTDTRGQNAASLAVQCGDYTRALHEVTSHTHDTFIANTLQYIERARGEQISLDEIERVLKPIYLELSEVNREDLHDYKGKLLEIMSELNPILASKNKEMLINAFESERTKNFAEFLTRNNYVTETKDNKEKLEKLEKLQKLYKERQEFYQTVSSEKFFFLKFAVLNGEPYINKLFGMSMSEAQLPGLVFTIVILNVPDEKTPGKVLPPVQINWTINPSDEVSYLSNYISTKELCGFLAFLGYKKAILIDETCSCFNEADGVEFTGREKRTLAGYISDFGLAYGGKKHKKKNTRKYKRKHSRKYKRKHTRKYKK
jgi:hypothetical protein